MPDSRKHRGPHPEDVRLFAESELPKLRQAARDFSWLLSRSYGANSALKLVGDRFQLASRQRNAVRRCSCSVDQARLRNAKLLERCLTGKPLLIDGFNVLTTVEAALAGAVILHAQDGCFRDLASMHGSYRKVAETRSALQLIGKAIVQLDAEESIWIFDQPVSNSGRICKMVREIAAQNDWNWQAILEFDPDKILGHSSNPVATADSAVLDQCENWVNLARRTIESEIFQVWSIKLP